MKKVITITFAVFCSISVFGQKGYRQIFNNVAEIIFPDTPKVEKVDNGTFYSYVYSDNIYLAEVSPSKKSLKDLFNSHLNDSVYFGVIDGSLKSSKGKLLYQKNIKRYGLEGIEFGYSAKIKGIDYCRYHQVFYFNNTLIIYGYWTKNSLMNDKNMKMFFESFKLTIQESDIKQGNTYDIFYKFGEVIGYILIMAFVALLGYGVVLIIKRIAYK